MKIGIIGGGMISGHHLQAAARYRGAEVIGIADRDGTRAAAQAKQFGVPHSFDQVSQLLAFKPDVVHVLTPPDSHAALAIQALEAGCHVYVEKPMAVTVAECEAMMRAASRSGRELCVGHCWNYIPVIARAQRLIASGAAGEIVQVAGSFNYDIGRNPTFGQGHWSSQLPGGLAEDLAVHLVSVLVRLIGGSQRTLALTHSTGQVPGAKSEEMRAIVEGERGLGTFSVSLRGRPDLILFDIWCTRMMLRLNVSSMSLNLYRKLPVPQKVGRGLANFDVAAQLVTGTVSATWQLLRGKVDGSYGIAPTIHAFYAALEAGRPSPIAPHEGAHAVEVLRAIWPVAEAAPQRLAPTG